MRCVLQTIVGVTVAALASATTYAIEFSGSDRTPTFFVNFGIGLTTYKSKAVLSNDTSVATGYGLGMWGGASKSLGTAVRIETDTTAFTYANSTAASSIASSFQDIIFRYRFFDIFYLGVLFNQTLFIVKKEDEEYLDLLGVGTGFNAGVEMPIGRNSLFIDVTSASVTQSKDTVQPKASAPTVGARTEIFLGGKIKLTKSLFDLILGYRQRSYSLTVNGESFAEVQTTTWFGFGMNMYW